MKFSFSRKFIFFLIVSCFFAFSLAAFIGIYRSFTNSPPESLFFHFFSIFDLYFLEFMILLLAGHLLIYRSLFWRIILYCLSSSFIFIYCFQIISLHYSGEFISSLAIDNIDHLYLFIDPLNIILLALIISFIILAIYLTERGNVPHSRTRHAYVTVLLILTAAICAASSAQLWLPETSQRTRIAAPDKHRFTNESPVASLASAVYAKYRERARIDAYPEITNGELDALKKMGFHFDRQAPYPLVKDTIYTDAAPFPFKSGKRAGPPNVIIIFSEGLSAREIGSYGSVYQDLTPFIDEFARHSMVVKRYYNHTAATYRGLHGQLASIFPLYGGAGGWHSEEIDVSGRSYLTLADLFRKRGYETIFLDSHHKDHRSRVDEMMGELGFETTVTGDELAEAYLDGAAPLEDLAYSDQQYFDSVIAYLENRLKRVEADQPFLMSLYNFGTHAFLNHSKDGYRYHSYNNVVLNNTHNFDFAFGRLWNYIQSSSYRNNTVLVFTADHCHFHESAFLDAFSEPDYEQKFVDQIPLIIWDPNRLLPAEYDAENASSIDFAPTMAHYFGLDNVSNPFMGISIFDKDRRFSNQISVAALGPHNIYLIDGNTIHRIGEDGPYEPTLKVLDKYIGIARKLELDNRIWHDGLISE